MSDLPKRRPAPPPTQPPTASSGARPAGPPSNYVEFATPPDPASQHVAVFPALAQPKERPPRPPRGRRRPRIVVSVPMWLLAGLGLLGLIAGLLFVPALAPLWRAPAESPLDDGEPGVGVIGTGPSGAASADSAVRPDASGGAGPFAGPDATAGPAGTSAPSATANPDRPPNPGGVAVSYFSATTLGAVLGYRVIVEITNTAAAVQDWESVGVGVSGGVPLDMVVDEPATGVRVYAGNGSACVVPATPETASLDPGETLRIVFRINALLASAPGPHRINDAAGCPSA